MASRVNLLNLGKTLMMSIPYYVHNSSILCALYYIILTYIIARQVKLVMLFIYQKCRMAYKYNIICDLVLNVDFILLR